MICPLCKIWFYNNRGFDGYCSQACWDDAISLGIDDGIKERKRKQLRGVGKKYLRRIK